MRSGTSYTTLVRDPRLMWPDTRCVAVDGYLYVTANGGRAFYVSPDHLEEDILAHYVRHKSTTIP